LRGLRDMDDGEQQIDDPEVLAQVRRQARKTILQAVVSAAALTVLFLLVPL
jgi:hypothetical protein